MTEIVLKRSTIERTLFSIVIVILLILLALCYFNHCDCSASTTAERASGVNTTANMTAALVNSSATPASPALPNCSDELKNQDETDIDCGGTTCAPCAEGKSCKLNRDCVKGFCADGVCNADKKLSGDFSLSINKVEYAKNEVTGATKVTSVTVSVTNGLDKNLAANLEIYVQTTDGRVYLNQLNDEATPVPYAIINLPPLAKGMSLKSQKYELKGLYTGASYLTNYDRGFYDPGDDFRILVKVIEGGTGDVLATATKRVSV